MKFLGSKRLLAKHLLPIILKDRKPGQCYVEPFVGGGNMIEHVDGYRIGADGDKDVIKALKCIKNYPYALPRNNQELDESRYKALKYKAKNTPHLLNEVDCYISFACSFGAKKWGGYPRDKTVKRDLIAEQFRAAQKQSAKLVRCILKHSDYDKLNIPDNSIIYCDPPYQGTTGYGTKFNHDEFWQWCRDKSKEGHQVFISEYSAPGDFICVWSKEHGVNFDSSRMTKQRRVEKLFIPPKL